MRPLLLTLTLVLAIQITLPVKQAARLLPETGLTTATPTPAADPFPPVAEFRARPRSAEPNQPVTVEIKGLPAAVVAGEAEACLALVNTQESEIQNWPIEPVADQTLKLTIGSIEPGRYRLELRICALPQGSVIDAAPQLDPLATLAFTIKPRSGQFDLIDTVRSPDGQWTALVNHTTGSLIVSDWRNNQRELFPDGSAIGSAVWSPDSRRLLAVRTHWLRVDQQQGVVAAGPAEVWRVDLDVQPRTVSTPTLIYTPPESDYGHNVAPPPQQVVFGQWSPDSRHVLFGVSLLSASLLADGIPPLVLDTDTGDIDPIAREVLPAGMSPLELGRDNTALVNPRYHSWSPDGTKLAITAGGYRSAQINKWLNIFDLTTGQVTTVISRSAQVPGIVAWSPAGDSIAYAAVETTLTGDDWADNSTFDNPAIAARRIYLLDPATGAYHRLNTVERYQDAPVWSRDGQQLYYVQRNGDHLDLMVADPGSGKATPVPGVSQPVDRQDPLRPNVGYYGQFDREELLAAMPEEPPGATVTGRVVNGAGARTPVADLPLWIGDAPDDAASGRTNADGSFTLTGLQPGLIRVRDSHLEFEVPVQTITDTIDVGLLPYPLIHPPNFYYWQAAPPPEPPSLQHYSEETPFDICYTAADWQRPTRTQQRQSVWSQRPFSNHSPDWLTWWFEQPAVLYTSEAIFEQSYPAGPKLDALTADWRYLLGLWTDGTLPFAVDSAGLSRPQTACAYDDQALADLLQGRLIELWLLDYRAVKIVALDPAEAGYDPADLCDPQDAACTERPGYHFVVQVEPEPGYQVIRFKGAEAVFAVHLVDPEGQPVLELPQRQPDRWPVVGGF
ncbi:MAG: PD40 domain-containing protein [Anaerolineales bacterium]|nr:PD40 domain-containing protein [Anaerolineales bacterium]